MNEITEIKSPFGFIKRYDLSSGRWYMREIDGVEIFKPSVTTVLNVIDKGYGFNKWLGNSFGYEAAMEYATFTADRGTRGHINIQSLIAGIPVPTEGMEDIEIKMLMGFVQWYNDYKPEILSCEETLWDRDYPVAGTADLVCRIDGKLHLIDYKTGKHYDTHQLQLTAYGQLHKRLHDYEKEEMGDKEPILSVLRLYEWRDNPDMIPKYDWKKYKSDDVSLDHAVQLWKWQNKIKDLSGFTPKIIEELPSVLILNENKGDNNDAN